ncbi:MAG: hypothetical protein HYT12_04125 [Candidatus Liptonbacteria bacterium]|nr:hypothetical protein [Candidatus Liptonbacteria bacterium]
MSAKDGRKGIQVKPGEASREEREKIESDGSGGKQTFPLELTSVVFRDYALRRFAERLAWVDPGAAESITDFEPVARKLLAESTEEKPSRKGRGYAIRRLLNNHCEPARYFVNSGWRFAISEEPTDGKYVVFTVERRMRPL